MNRLTWLVVGTGDIAEKRVMPALDAEPRCRITAVCDTVQQRARSAAEPRGAQVFTDLDTALSDSGADAVYVSTPVYLHTPHAARALAAGKHVLVEKPIALGYREAAELAAAAERAGTKCGAAYFRRFHPKYDMAQQMLKDGEFGNIVLIRMTYFSWFDPEPDDPKYWRVIPERGGGGPLSDMGSHMFDVMIGLLGLPTTVYAKTQTLIHDYAAEDSSVIIMTMPNGAQAIASFHWCSKTWSHEFEIVGTEAKVKWHPYDSDSALKTVGREITDVPTPTPENVHYPLIEDFTTAVLDDREPRVPPAEAAKTNLLLDAVYTSARNNKEVPVRPDDGE